MTATIAVGNALVLILATITWKGKKMLHHHQLIEFWSKLTCVLENVTFLACHAICALASNQFLHVKKYCYFLRQNPQKNRSILRTFIETMGTRFVRLVIFKNLSTILESFWSVDQKSSKISSAWKKLEGKLTLARRFGEPKWKLILIMVAQMGWGMVFVAQFNLRKKQSVYE
jgi:hypothetical protein